MKPNTKRLLEQTRRINADLRKANEAAGAVYDDRWIPVWQRSEVGKGAKQAPKLERTTPVTDHEYRGFRFLRDKETGHFWSIQPQEGLALPKELEGKWTSVAEMERAVDRYLSR